MKVLSSITDTQDAVNKEYIDGLLADYAKTANLGALAFKSSLAFSDLTSKPTTLGEYGIKDAVVDIDLSDYPLPTDTQAFTSYCYATRGWKTSGPVISFPSGSYKGNIQIEVSADNPKMFINSIVNGIEGVWTEVLTPLNISQYAVKVGAIAKDVDLDDYGDAGVYSFWGNITNSAGGSYGTLLVTRATNDYFTGQLFTNSQGHLFSRMREGEWRDWRTILDDNNYTSYVYSKADSDAKYVPFAGNKTISGNVTFSGTVTSQGTFQTRYFDFFQDGVRTGGMAADASDVETLYFITKNYAYRTIIHGGNIGHFTAGKATQLANARLIWGQRFDGTENITGLATFDNGLTSNGNITLAGTSISSWKDIETNYVAPTYLAKSAYIMPTNSFDANSGQLGINMMSNALYAADSRFTVTGEGFLNFSAQSLFNGNYEDGCYVEKGATATLTISNNGNSIIAGYPYGDLYLSFYYDEIPESVVVEVYCNYASQGIGWHTLDLAGQRGQKINGVGHVWYYHNDYYNVTDIRITITAQNGKRARLSEVDWHLSRGSLSNLPIVTKFGINQTLYGKMTFAAGVNANTLTVTGATSLYSTLSVSGLTTLNSSLNVFGQATLSGGAFLPPSKTIRFQDAATETFTISFNSEVGGLNLSGATRTLGLASFQKGIEIASGQSIAFVDSNGVKQYITLDEENGAIKVIGNFFATGQNAAGGAGGEELGMLTSWENIPTNLEGVTLSASLGIDLYNASKKVLTSWDDAPTDLTGYTVSADLVQTMNNEIMELSGKTIPESVAIKLTNMCAAFATGSTLTYSNVSSYGLALTQIYGLRDGIYTKVIDDTSSVYNKVWEYGAEYSSSGYTFYFRMGDKTIKLKSTGTLASSSYTITHNL